MSTAIDEELSIQLKNWNPMRDDYKDSNFNTYSSGPGAELEASLQPAEMAKQLGSNQKIKNPYLVFKGVPTTLTQEGLMNICSQYANCLRSRKHGQNMYFIDFQSINDMERAFTGLQGNSYGFRVELGRNREQPPISKGAQQSANALPSSDQPSLPSQQIDYDRSYQVSSRNAPRPKFSKNPLVSKDDYDNSQNNLQRNDPQRHFMIEDDAHEMERLPYGKKTEPEDGKYNYHTGRAYYTMPQKGKQFIEEKQKCTVGSFDGSKRLQRINLEKQALLNAGQILQDLNKSLVKGKNPNQVESIKGSGIFSKPSQTYEKAKIGPCEHCSKSCDTVCDRCMSSFCSVECQKAEWNRHRYICGKPASMWPAWAKQLAKQRNPSDNKITEQIESPSSSTSQKDSTRKPALKAQLPPSGNNVILTAISKTNVVFVRSTLYDDNLLFFNTVSRIQKEAKNQSHIQHTPERGDIVLTKFKDQQYNRAMILNPDNLDEIKLIYVDYGNIDSKSLDDLYNAPVEFWNLPRMAVPIILKNVPEFFMTDEVRKYMYSYLNTDLKIVYDTEDLDNGINLSELFDSTSNVSFNETIASFKAGAAEQKKAPVVYREFLQYSPLPTGENVELLVIDSSLLQTGFVSCTTEAYTNEIEKFQKDIQAYVQANETKSTYTPRVNELCLAKYSEDNLWYRGRCIEVVGDGHPTILFFDYGNLSIVSVENIRKYPEEFTFPIMTADCEISGLPSEIGDDLKNDLEELLEPGTKIICEKVEYFEEDNFYSIDLGDLLKKMLP
ncbi:protein vreteno-like isoform X2 [Eupeodes corollae]|uniref:protein vreteno-like isoform X2 n=1 Tax=Eupeodes corollae TaxID=290404 RepID=UPI0024900BE2|nr:protein vreteno-like isoform X2 [Eupeodes corollae]